MNGEQSHGSGENMTTYKAKTIQQHILRCISNRGPHARTLIVGMQGPQGSGKTTITDHVQKLLYDEGKTSAVFSLDGEQIVKGQPCATHLSQIFTSLIQD